MKQTTETAEQYHKRITDRDEEDLRSLLKTVYGKRFIYRIFKKCYIFGMPFVAGEPDTTAFNLGKQDVGKSLLAQVLDVRPEAYNEMLKMEKEDENGRKLVEASQHTEES
jgi:hypothetical protein